MVNPKKLMEMAAKINTSHGHETKVQSQFLHNQRHGAEIDGSRKARRIAKAKMRDQMGLNKKSEICIFPDCFCDSEVHCSFPKSTR